MDERVLVHAGTVVAHLKEPVPVALGQTDLHPPERKVGLQRLPGQHGVLGVLNQLPQSDLGFVPVELLPAERADQGGDVGDLDGRIDGSPVLHPEQFREAFRGVDTGDGARREPVPAEVVQEGVDGFQLAIDAAQVLQCHPPGGGVLRRKRPQ